MKTKSQLVLQMAKKHGYKVKKLKLAKVKKGDLRGIPFWQDTSSNISQAQFLVLHEEMHAIYAHLLDERAPMWFWA